MCTQTKTRARNHSNAGIQGVHPPCLYFIVAKVKMEKRKKRKKAKKKMSQECINSVHAGVSWCRALL